jgi:thiamine-phosphate pyrophosphorylase
VCEPARPGEVAARPRALASLLSAAIAGGVQVVQLREKHLADDQILRLAAVARERCSQLGALLIINDRPDLALQAGADGVHVGQDDMPVERVRELVGADMLIGLSTHSREQIEASGAVDVDYIAVGPVHETPTKPGRPAVGVELVRYAAEHAARPFFAIGGIDASNISMVTGAGATRVCVLRAISRAGDPERAARELRELIDARPAEA